MPEGGIKRLKGGPSLVVDDILKHHGTPAVDLRGRKHLVGSDSAQFPLKVEPPQTSDFPLLLQAGNVSLKDFGNEFKEEVDAHLLKHGALIIRGLPCVTAEDFTELTNNLGWSIKNYAGGGTYREGVTKTVRISSAEPSVCCMEPHSDISHKEHFPLKISFFCKTPTPPGAGGETILSHIRNITRRMEQEGLVDMFEKKGGIIYQKIYWSSAYVKSPFSWQNMFYTEKKEDVEKELLGSDLKWLENDVLQVRTTLPALRVHPITGEKLWVNGIHTNNKSYYEHAEHIDTSNGSPMHTLFGNGEEIPAEVIDKIRCIIWSESAAIHLHAGDLVLVDNMLALHGRIGWHPDVPRALLLVHYEK